MANLLKSIRFSDELGLLICTLYFIPFSYFECKYRFGGRGRGVDTSDPPPLDPSFTIRLVNAVVRKQTLAFSLNKNLSEKH